VPKVSVIIPTYNRARLLVEAVGSVVEQTFTDWEIVIIDDGSTDHTPVAIHDLASREPRLRYVRQANAGRSVARNAGISLARGEYLVFLDSDDCFLPNKLERQVEYLDRYPHIGVVYADAYMCDEHGRVIQLYSLNEGRRHPSGWVLDHMVQANLVQLSTATARRYCVEQVRGFDEELPTGEDWDLWIRIAASYQFNYMDEPVSKYRIHRGMVTLDHTHTFPEAVAVREKIRKLPLFHQASPIGRRNYYCSYGILHSMIGDLGAGRQMFRRAMAEAPGSTRPYVLLALTCLGQRGFRAVACFKRWLSCVVRRRAPSPLPHVW